MPKNKKWIIGVSVVLGVAILAVLTIVMFRPNTLDATGMTIARLLAALSAGLLASIMTGSMALKGEIKPGGIAVTAAGGMAVFFLVLFVVPWPQPTSSPQSQTTISGSLHDGTGATISNVTMLVEPAPPSEVITDDEGRFEFDVPENRLGNQTTFRVEGYMPTSLLLESPLALVLSLKNPLSRQQAATWLAELRTVIFEKWQDPNTGGVFSGGSSDRTKDRPGEWTTAKSVQIAILSLRFPETAPTTQHEPILRALRWLVEPESGARRDGDAWGDVGYQDHTPDTAQEFPGCVESTSWAILALTDALNSAILRGEPELRRRVEQSLNGACRWLVAASLPAGGWGTFKDDELGARTYTTCMSIVAFARLLKNDQHLDDTQLVIDVRRTTREGVRWLHRTRRANGWPANNFEDGTGNIASTSHALFSLLVARRANIEVRTALDLDKLLEEHAERITEPATTSEVHQEYLTWPQFETGQLVRGWYWVPWTLALSGIGNRPELIERTRYHLEESWIENADGLPPWRLTLAAYGLAMFLEESEE